MHWTFNTIEQLWCLQRCLLPAAWPKHLVHVCLPHDIRIFTFYKHVHNVPSGVACTATMDTY